LSDGESSNREAFCGDEVTSDAAGSSARCEESGASRGMTIVDVGSKTGGGKVPHDDDDGNVVMLSKAGIEAVSRAWCSMFVFIEAGNCGLSVAPTVLCSVSDGESCNCEAFCGDEGKNDAAGSSAVCDDGRAWRKTSGHGNIAVGMFAVRGASGRRSEGASPVEEWLIWMVTVVPATVRGASGRRSECASLE